MRPRDVFATRELLVGKRADGITKGGEMSLRRQGIRVSLGILFVAALAACAPAAPQEIEFTATDHAFSGPTTAQAGWRTVSLTNNGQEGHHLQLVLLEEGKTVDDLVAAMGENPGAFPSWARAFGGPNPGDPTVTSSAVVDLLPGSYAVIDVIPDAQGVPHVMSGMHSSLAVTAAGDSPEEPTSDISVALADFSFTVEGSLSAGQHTIRVTNEGEQVHEMFLVHLQPGKTADDYLGSPPGSPPPGTAVGGITGIEPGAAQYVPVTLESGSYAMFCFFPDPASHAPHFVMGMVSQFEIP
jgi:hypothetical protein